MNFKENVFNTFYTKIFLLVFGIISSVIYARVLGPHNYGTGILLLILPPIAIKLLNFGIAGSLTYFVNQYPDEKKEYISTALCFAVFLSVFVTSALMLAMPIIMEKFYKHSVPEELLFIVFIFSPLYTFQLFFRALFRALNMIKQFNYITQIIPTILSLVFTVLIISVLKMGLKGYVLIDISITSIITTAMLLVLFKKGVVSLRFNFGKFKQMFHFGLRGYFTNVSAALSGRIDKLFLMFFLTPEQVGIYQIAVSLKDKLMILPHSLGFPLLPKIAGMSTVDAALTINQIMKKFIVAMLACIIVSLLVAPLVLDILYGEQYFPAYYAFIFLSISTLFLSFNNFIGIFAVGTGKPEVKSIQKLLSLSINVLFLYVLVTQFGIVGCALSILFSELIVFLGSVSYYKKVQNTLGVKIYRIRVKDLFEMFHDFQYKIKSSLFNILS